VGFACGAARIINGLGTIKESMDSGTVCALQEASARTLLTCEKEAEDIRNLYKMRAEVFTEGLRKLGYEVIDPKATLYLWVKVPGKMKSMEFSGRVLDEADMVVTPGIGFGASGDGYFRIALTVEEPVIEKALERLAKIKA
jgi:LL-diaminopimelate aminotransferase